MKIISYNLNGLRAAARLNVQDWLKQEDADMICLQEVRAEQKVCEEILREFRNLIVAKKKDIQELLH